jgi:phosphoserine phosphatase
VSPPTPSPAVPQPTAVQSGTAAQLGTADRRAPLAMPCAPPPADVPTLLVTVTGSDRPGVTSELFESLTGTGVEVLDVEQVVVRGTLVLSVLVTAGDDEAKVRDAVTRVGSGLGLAVDCRSGRGDNAPRPRGRLHVTILGAPLLPAAVAGIAGRLAEQGANIDRVSRLSRWPVTTVQFDVSGARVTALRRALARDASALGVDVAVSPAGLDRRGRRLVVLDVDSTLIQDEVIELLAAHAGREAEVAEVTERAMRGELDFAASLHERVACLAGLPVSVLADVRDSVQLTAGAQTLCRTLRRLGDTVALVSGGFVEVVEPLARDLGVAHVRANRLGVEGGRLTGTVVGDVVDRAGKARALREFAAAEGLPLSRTVAVGDGANDLDMLAAAGLGVAFNAKPLVREQADTSVTVPYLDAVLYLLGITREEIEDADADGER